MMNTNYNVPKFNKKRPPPKNRKRGKVWNETHSGAINANSLTARAGKSATNEGTADGYVTPTFDKAVKGTLFGFYEEVFKHLTDTYHPVWMNEEIYIYNEQLNIYQKISHKQFELGYIAPAFKTRNIKFTNVHSKNILSSILADIPLLAGTQRKLQHEKRTNAFKVSNGEPSEWVAVGDNQLVKINDNFKVEVSDKPRDSELFFTSATNDIINTNEILERPAGWNQFLNSSFPNDPDSQLLVEQMMGYIIYGKHNAQVIFALLGQKGGTGKGVITRMIENLLGEGGHYAVSHPRQLAGRFAAADYYNKRVVTIQEAQKGDDNSNEVGIAIMKQISGGDSIKVEPKGLSSFSTRTNLVIVVVSNNENLGWVSSNDVSSMGRRLKAIHFQNAISPEDRVENLEKRLSTSSVLRWCLQKYAEAIRDNKDNNINYSMFASPVASAELQERNLRPEIRGSKPPSIMDFVDEYVEFTRDPSDYIVVEAIKDKLEEEKIRLQHTNVRDVIRNLIGLDKAPRKTINGRKVSILPEVKWVETETKVIADAMSIVSQSQLT